jgi:hypothetical protein
MSLFHRYRKKPFSARQTSSFSGHMTMSAGVNEWSRPKAFSRSRSLFSPVFMGSTVDLAVEYSIERH